MSDYGIKVSLPGYNALLYNSQSAQHIKLFSLISTAALLKIYLSAKVTLTNTASVTISHGFSYKPLFWVFMNNGTDIVPIYNTITGERAYIDATSLVIVNNSGATRDFYYYIFYDPI